MKKKHKFYLVCLLFIIVLVILLGKILLNHYLFKIGYDQSHPNNLKKTFQISIYGEDMYASRQIKKEYQKKTEVNEPIKVTKIETSVLPLEMVTISLRNFVDFPDQGGGIIVAKNQLIIMDRFGGFYKVTNHLVEKIQFPSIPNSINKYVVNTHVGLNSNSMRVISADFEPRSNRLYVGYTKYLDKSRNCFSIAYIDLDKNLRPIKMWKEVYKSQAFQNSEESHGGGGKLLIVENSLYFTIGYPDVIGYPNESLNHGLPNSQDKQQGFGKVFELNLNNYSVSTISIGHRNPQGLTFWKNRSLLSVEHGPQGGDEINLIEKGRNFGWPYKTFGTMYGRYDSPWQKFSKQLDSNTFSDPVFAYVPSIGISSIYALKKFNERWESNLLVGSLKAQTVYRIYMGDNHNVIFSEPIWIGHRVRDINQLDDKIILLTDDSKVIFLSVDKEDLNNNLKNDGLLSLEPKLNKCLNCHSFQQVSPNSIAPSLANVLGRKIGSDSFDHYSTAIKSKSGVWDKTSLVKYITNPQAFIPGTAMPKLGLTEEESSEIVDIISR